MPAGAPRKYDRKKVMTLICDRIAEGQSLRTISSEASMPAVKVVLEWIQGDEELRNQYVRAREQQADYIAAEIIEIADNSGKDVIVGADGIKRVDHENINRDRLRVDARKWYAGKLAPKKYGDKVTNEHTGANGGAIKIEHVGNIPIDPKDI